MKRTTCSTGEEREYAVLFCRFPKVVVAVEVEEAVAQSIRR